MKALNKLSHPIGIGNITFMPGICGANDEKCLEVPYALETLSQMK